MPRRQCRLHPDNEVAGYKSRVVSSPRILFRGERCGGAGNVFFVPRTHCRLDPYNEVAGYKNRAVSSLRIFSWRNLNRKTLRGPWENRRRRTPWKTTCARYATFPRDNPSKQNVASMRPAVGLPSRRQWMRTPYVVGMHLMIALPECVGWVRFREGGRFGGISEDGTCTIEYMQRNVVRLETFYGRVGRQFGRRYLHYYCK